MRKLCVPGSFLPAHAQEPGNEAKHDDAVHIQDTLSTQTLSNAELISFADASM